jgi:hypothetical protein
MNTQELIKQVRESNYKKALWYAEKHGGLEGLKEFYEKRPFEGAWWDIKTAIEVLEEGL